MPTTSRRSIASRKRRLRICGRWIVLFPFCRLSAHIALTHDLVRGAQLLHVFAHPGSQSHFGEFECVSTTFVRYECIGKRFSSTNGPNGAFGLPTRRVQNAENPRFLHDTHPPPCRKRVRTDDDVGRSKKTTREVEPPSCLNPLKNDSDFRARRDSSAQASVAGICARPAPQAFSLPGAHFPIIFSREEARRHWKRLSSRWLLIANTLFKISDAKIPHAEICFDDEGLR